MLTQISKCDIDASLFQIELKTSMEQILRRDIRMQQRLARLELTCAIRPTSMKFLNCDDDDNWIITPTTTQAGSQSSKQVSTTKTAGTTRRYSLMTSPREFELILGTSRVYRRVEGNECDMSFGDSDVRTHAWSILSGLSLSDISVISVIALPLSTAEVQQLQRALMAPVPPEFTRFQLERARDGIAVSAIKKEQDKYKLLKTCNFKGCNCSFADGKALMAHSKTGPSLSGLEVYTSVASEGDTKEEENATEAKPMADTAETEVIATEATIDPRTSVTLTEARMNSKSSAGADRLCVTTPTWDDSPDQNTSSSWPLRTLTHTWTTRLPAFRIYTTNPVTFSTSSSVTRK